MNLEKHLEFFDPILVKESVHIIGLGAIGSHIAELLARLGIENFHIYDYDKVEDKNVANQMYFIKQEGDFKVHAVEDVIRGINPDAKIETYINGWNKHVLSGYVFICVDSIAARKQIVEDNMYNDYVKAMFDFRMRLSDAQHYAADWKNQKQKKSLWQSMDFTQEEADKETPVSACGTTLSVIPTIKTITALGVSNFINYVKGSKLRSTILVDAFDFDIVAAGTN